MFLSASSSKPHLININPASLLPFIEMAKRVANILRVVLSLQLSGEGTPDPRHIPLCQLAPHIGRLPMPEDYALEELRSLTQSYLQEYVISH